ncbi:hypothetical protein KI694_17685 [Enterobacter oligotrophicus]|nr:hypothetical protein [Enterobacter oligotrophicus]MBT9427372.1 hypothetical protein [Enterobacter oligotrophicus]
MRLDFILVVIPGTNGGINEAAKEKQETDKQYNAGHPRVKSMSFVHTRGLTHCFFPGHTLLGDTDIKAQREERVNSLMCKKSSTLTLVNDIEHKIYIYDIDNKEKVTSKNCKKALFK